MTQLEEEIFVCLDCETTGLDLEKDSIIEVAAVTFNRHQIFKSYESLVNPLCPIPEESRKIHNISDTMVADKPTIDQVLPELLELVSNHIIVGHGIKFDIDLVVRAAAKSNIPSRLQHNHSIDTLRLARLYGESPQNSLEQLCKHFNISYSGAHRAMTDVKMNVEVFKYLTQKFKTTDQVFKVLSKPIKLREMPFGKHKGRSFKDIPLNYLRWAADKDFDQDLLFSIRSELNKRKQGNLFSQAGNPFHDL